MNKRDEFLKLAAECMKIQTSFMAGSPHNEPWVKTWSVYILECSDGTYYTGMALNVEKRFKKHNSGKGAKYTKYRRPLKLVYEEVVGDRSETAKREYEIKQFSRLEKEKLIKGE